MITDSIASPLTGRVRGLIGDPSVGTVETVGWCPSGNGRRTPTAGWVQIAIGPYGCASRLAFRAAARNQSYQGAGEWFQ
jgi:hypothetical protein